MSSKQKLELTWIGKEKQTRLESRVLVEVPEKSYRAKEKKGENDQFENMLIHGDNLLALKALEQDFTGKIKCIYIDPPFNTKKAFTHYDDCLEHSIWLDLMRRRLEILYKLLDDSGTIYVHIDDNEQAYLKVLMDEIFQRDNFIQMISIKRASPAGFKVINPGPLTVTDYVLLYAKNKAQMTYYPQRIEVEYDENYDLVIENIEDAPEEWRFSKLVDVLYKRFNFSSWNAAKKAWGSNWKNVRNSFLGDIALEFANSVVSIRDPHKPSDFLKKKLQESKLNKGKVITIQRENNTPIYLLNGGSLSFYRDKLRNIDGRKVPTELLTDFWSDINFAGIAKEGGVEFKNGKKPEMLLRRILELATLPGDLILDSFLGSGTTAAVAHKMGRRWIGIELGDQCYDHCLPRLRRVVDGIDQSGISKAVNWQGGGGFRFFELGESAIKVDDWGQEVINEKFNAEMLAEAVCKIEGFTYAPSQEEFFIHGYSAEQSFIYVTANYVKAEMLHSLSEQLGPKRFLTVYCMGFDEVADLDNIIVKKIPESILKKFEIGRDNYDLNVCEVAADGDDDE